MVPLCRGSDFYILQLLFGELQLDGAHHASLAGLEERPVPHVADLEADAHGIAWYGELATFVADPGTDFLAGAGIVDGDVGIGQRCRPGTQHPASDLGLPLFHTLHKYVLSLNGYLDGVMADDRHDGV